MKTNTGVSFAPGVASTLTCYMLHVNSTMTLGSKYYLPHFIYKTPEITQRLHQGVGQPVLKSCMCPPNPVLFLSYPATLATSSQKHKSHYNQ